MITGRSTAHYRAAQSLAYLTDAQLATAQRRAPKDRAIAREITRRVVLNRLFDCVDGDSVSCPAQSRHNSSR